MIDFVRKESYDVQDLKEIVALLRGPGGCPWDAEQTHQSIRRNFLEEAYEVAEAIDEESTPHLQEELGDVLLQVMFHASIEEDAGRFDLNAVADMVSKKLIFRHPHVFADTAITGTQDVLVNWEELKKQEKHQETASDTVDAVAKSLPGLWRAEKIQKKAAKVGFDWDKVDDALEKVVEETAELKQAIAEHSNIQDELGDLLFAAVNVARFVKVDPEDAVQGACDKFAKRFRRVEELALAQGKQLEEMTLAEMDALWDSIKHEKT